ncbi:MAG TPA: hypothetical protein VGQ18_01655 [Gemmatimonadales bacterium]|jgi:hypothetical protein|nr:hypothetical protein [Gemmatimonadales bacterium]
MADLTLQLLSTLEQITSLLRKHGEEHWLQWIVRDVTLIREGDFHGVEHLLSAYGGMGSFNDLYLCPENGHRIEGPDVEQVNKQLRALASQAYDLARHLERAA